MQALANEGAAGARSLADLAQALKPPRAVWLMMPAAAVDQTIESLAPLLARDDVLIDGGNSMLAQPQVRQIAANDLGNRRDHGTDDPRW